MSRNIIHMVAAICVMGAFVIGLGGCGKQDVEPIVQYAVLPHPYFDGVHAGADALAKDAGVKIRFVVGQESSQANANSNIDTLATQGHKAFSIYPVDPAAAMGLFSRLKSQGCIAVAYGAQPAKGTDCPFAVGTDTQAAATQAAEMLATLMNHKGRVLNFLESMTDANTPIRDGAIKAVIAKYKDMQIIQTIGDVTNEGDARKKIEQTMVSLGDQADGIICTGATTTNATATLLDQLNRRKDAKRIAFVGLDDDKRVLEAIRNGTIDATLAQNPYGQGYISCAILDLMLKGWKPKADYTFIDSGCVPVTKANVDNYQQDIEKFTKSIVADLKTKYLQGPEAK